MDEEYVPLVDVPVWLLSQNRFVRTDAEGRYEFRSLEAGDHVLSVDQYGYAALTYSVQVWRTAMSELDFVLRKVPTGEPYHETFPHAGFIVCEAAVGSVPEDTQYFDCGQALEALQQPNQGHEVAFGVGTRRILSELDWEPATPAAKKLTLGLGPLPQEQGEPFSEVQGFPGIRALVVGWILQTLYPDGGHMEAYVRAAPAIDEHGMALTDRHPPISAGLAAQQTFDLYTTVFYFSQGAPAFTALP